MHIVYGLMKILGLKAEDSMIWQVRLSLESWQTLFHNSASSINDIPKTLRTQLKHRQTFHIRRKTSVWIY